LSEYLKPTLFGLTLAQVIYTHSSKHEMVGAKEVTLSDLAIIGEASTFLLHTHFSPLTDTNVQPKVTEDSMLTLFAIISALLIAVITLIFITGIKL
jgi:hypothetical protein